ncbi:MAG: metalloregulator ArsR/SmtB family transcription factor [Verrucomicrobia bacterium]|nr:metalloregulator ArsR/SmtB family transcription factor [Verrucomicrobiota bacterium]
MPSLIQSLRLLADATRLRLLLLLEQAELTVAEIQEILGMGQSRISAHLAQLKRAGLVRDRRAGKNIYYGLVAAGATEGAVVDPNQARLRELIAASAQEIPESARDRTALALALRKREDRARDYFNRLAGKFGRAHCPGRSWQALAHMLFGLLPPMVIADLGAGEGTLSQLLARTAKQVIAVDSSEKMVEFGSALAREHGFANLEYRLGDMQEPPIAPGSVDLAIFSQALHHAAAPPRAVAAAERILKPGGRLVILDLLAHNFEQARELYADLWLGFSEVELHRLLETHGFRDLQVAVVSREAQSPHFQTVLATGTKPGRGG